MTDARRHAFGAILIGLALWEAAGYVDRAPTITRFSHERPWTRLLWISWFLLVLRHLWRPPNIAA